MYEELAKQLIEKKEPSALKDAQTLLHEIEKYDFKAAHNLNRKLRKAISASIKNNGGSEMVQLYRNSLLFDAPYNFDCYCRYIEADREYNKQFYLPRRKALYMVSEALQGIADDDLDLLAISLPPGVGKSVSNNTPVLTRNGWKNHGDLVIGDEVVAPTGEFVPVLLVHPKCNMEYEVEFTNHEKVICHGNHVWTVYNKHRQKEEKLSTKDMLGNYENNLVGRGHRYYYMLPHRKPLSGDCKELPVMPYTLGVWLGDGTNKSPIITSPKCDCAVIESVVSKDGYRISSQWVHKTTGVPSYYIADLGAQLRSVGMCIKKQRTIKHIPEEYLTASLEQRLELLAGLIDTDGTLSKSEKKYHFSTTEEQLKDDVVALISTFGWRCSVCKEEAKLSTSGVQGRKPCYGVQFNPTLYIPCRLERKQLKEFSKPRRIAIAKITPITEEVEGNCITVLGGEYCVGKTMLPTHNTTTAIFFLTWMVGRHPEMSNICGSHSNSFLRGVYDECLRIMSPTGEYLFRDVFPNANIISTNALDMRIDVGASKNDCKRFESIQMGSIGSKLAGKIRAEGLLYCDDLVDGIETALSAEQLDKLWQKYTDDFRQRKIGFCKELHIATRWSVRDPIGRLQNMFGDSPRAKFLVFPALNDKDESNFDYGNFAGFTTKFYHEQREIMDDASWRALYMNEPIEREGQLYNAQELRRYFELPNQAPDAILAVCDTKDKGTDYCVMPVVYQYGNDYYVERIFCDNGDPKTVEARLLQFICDCGIQMARFESNAAGGKIAEKIQTQLKEKGADTKITTKFTTANKEVKIIVESTWVKDHCLFKDDSVLKKDKEYRKALNFLCGYTMAATNKHDDVPDAFAMLSEYIQSLTGGVVAVFSRPY